MTSILAFAGSARRDALNPKLARLAAQLAAVVRRRAQAARYSRPA